jgi:tetratricopeptide (TPR) repeat protein
MDIDKSNLLMQQAVSQGSIAAAQNWARFRIYGLHCQAEPALVAKEIEQRLNETEDPDPYWHTLLAYAYEELGRKDDAINQYEQAIAKGDIETYSSLAYLYYERGNMALYESLMEEGIKKGSIGCCTYRSEMDEEAFHELDYDDCQTLHRNISDWLHRGMEKGEGLCAYFLWYHYYYGQLGFYRNEWESRRYLKEGVRLGHVASLTTMAELAEEGKWSETLTPMEIGELWLRAARYSSQDEDALKGLSRVSDPAFLLKHKEELEKYWQPLFATLDEDKDDDDGRWDAYV